VGGFPEIIDHGEDGFLIPGHDPEQFARSCLKLLSDPELLEQMGKAGQKKIAEKFSIQRMTEDYYQLYEKLSGPGGKQLL
jgi:glycosyltransferase involved in cell wall biosynthesis